MTLNVEWKNRCLVDVAPTEFFLSLQLLNVQRQIEWMGREWDWRDCTLAEMHRQDGYVQSNMHTETK